MKHGMNEGGRAVSLVDKEDVVECSMHIIERVIEDMCGVKVDSDRYFDLEDEIRYLIEAHLGMPTTDGEYRKWTVMEVKE